MFEIPKELIQQLAQNEVEEAHKWWSELSEESQRELTQMWDGHYDDVACYGTVEDGVLTWHPLPIELVGKFVDSGDASEKEMWIQDFIEYVNNHPEESYRFVWVERRFHIGCQAHPVARKMMLQGWLPASFRCPFENLKCPMIAMLALQPGKDLRFFPCRRSEQRQSG